ncbi:MAG: YbaN family protein [Desulfuromonadales bacterium]|nr:YbaN family protein [Desulfuromonadales bacterium]
MTNISKTPVSNRGLRIALAVIGLLSTLLGVIGIFVPLLPTVPLLLLATACFARSSERFHHRLLEHPQLGPMVRGYLHGQGIPLRAKVRAIALIWASISLSALFFIPLLWVKILLITIGLCITIYLLRLPVPCASSGATTDVLG